MGWRRRHQDVPDRESFPLHRYLGGSGGALEFDSSHLFVDAPIFAEPLTVPLVEVLGTSMLDVAHWTDLFEGDVLPQPQHTDNHHLLHANLAIVFTVPQAQPPTVMAPRRWDTSRPLQGVSLRLEKAGLASTMLEDLGVPYLEDIDATIQALRSRDA